MRLPPPGLALLVAQGPPRVRMAVVKPPPCSFELQCRFSSCRLGGRSNRSLARLEARATVRREYKMRLVTLTSVTLLLGASCALAQGTSNTMTSGRPSAVLDDATCQTIWQMASPNGATISQDQAVPYIVNFKMVDVDGDGTISADEFKAACGKGLVKNPKP